MRDYRRGSIWLVNFDPSVGTEIRNTRPALIISPTDFNNVRSKVTLLPISLTKVKAKTIKPVAVEVKPNSTNGLTIDSIVIAIEPNTFDKKRLVKYLGILEKDLLNKVESIFQKFFEV